MSNIENAFKDFFATLQLARMYPQWHPQFGKAIDNCFLSLKHALEDRESLVIGIVGDELAFEKEIFFDLSKVAKQMISYIKEREIERIEFKRALSKDELTKFFGYLITPKEELRLNPQESLTVLGVSNISAGKIKASSEQELQDAGKSVDFLSSYENSAHKVSLSIDSVLNEEQLDHLSLRLTIANVMDGLLGRYQEFLNFATLKRFDAKTFFHILNVSILSMHFSTKLGFSREEVLDMGTAGLFHDIGKMYISRKIIQKPAKLTNEEFHDIESHALIGTEIMLKYVDVLGVLPAVICFEHHLRFDLKGYPKLEFPKKPHTASLIVSICDVYDALSQKRKYKTDYPPELIYDIMIKEKGQGFDPFLLDKFFQINGVYPSGTIVLLNDKRVAVVKAANESDIFAPQVEIVSTEGRGELIDLKANKDKLKIDSSLDPLNEGKDYLPFIRQAGKP